MYFHIMNFDVHWNFIQYKFYVIEMFETKDDLVS